MPALVSATEALNACRTLFGLWARPSEAFLSTLQPEVVKSAYRRKALETHPDRFFHAGPSVQQRQAELFRTIFEAYDILRGFFQQRSREQRKPSHRPQQAPNEPKHRASSAGAASSGKTNTERTYDGALPRRTLQFGQYLYFRGRIQYRDLIKALAWQKSQRPDFGTIAMRWGWLTDNDIHRLVRHRGLPRLFGERAVHFGMLTPFQVKTVLAFQRNQQKRLGRYFVEQGMLSAAEIDRLFLDCTRHNDRLSRVPAQVSA